MGYLMRTRTEPIIPVYWENWTSTCACMMMIPTTFSALPCQHVTMARGCRLVQMMKWNEITVCLNLLARPGCALFLSSCCHHITAMPRCFTSTANPRVAFGNEIGNIGVFQVHMS